MKRKLISVNKIKLEPPFADLFLFNKVVSERIKKNITENGFYDWEPVHLWKGILIDGYTRHKVATNLKIEKIPAIIHAFDNELEALVFALKQQSCRRNRNDGDIFRNVEIVDVNRKKRGYNLKNIRKNTGATHVAPCGKKKKKKKKRTSEIIGEIVGVNRGIVQKVRTILDKGNEQTIEMVRSGLIGINKAYNIAMEKPKPEPTQKETNAEIFSKVSASLENYQELKNDEKYDANDFDNKFLDETIKVKINELVKAEETETHEIEETETDPFDLMFQKIKKYNEEQNKIAEMKLREQRKLGKLLLENPDTPKKISEKIMNEYKKLAEMYEDLFELSIKKQTRKNDKELTTEYMLRIANKRVVVKMLKYK